jgi:hypothetical protein
VEYPYAPHPLADRARMSPETPRSISDRGLEVLRLFPDLGWEKVVRWERTAMKERPTGVKFVG